MKLLTRANTTLHTEALLRKVCVEVFDEMDIQEKTWREAVKKLVLMQFVTVDDTGTEKFLIIRQDTYFDKVITEYPQVFQLQQIKLDLVRLKKVFVERKDEEALLDLGFTFSDLDQAEEALDCFNKALSINPFYAYAWYLKGLTLSILDQNE